MNANDQNITYTFYRLGPSFINEEISTREFVVPDMAESTTMLPFSAVMIRQTSFILAGEPTEVPPNF